MWFRIPRTFLLLQDIEKLRQDFCDSFEQIRSDLPPMPSTLCTCAHNYSRHTPRPQHTTWPQWPCPPDHGSRPPRTTRPRWRLPRGVRRGRTPSRTGHTLARCPDGPACLDDIYLPEPWTRRLARPLPPLGSRSSRGRCLVGCANLCRMKRPRERSRTEISSVGPLSGEWLAAICVKIGHFDGPEYKEQNISSMAMNALPLGVNFFTCSQRGTLRSGGKILGPPTDQDATPTGWIFSAWAVDHLSNVQCIALRPGPGLFRPCLSVRSTVSPAWMSVPRS